MTASTPQKLSDTDLDLLIRWMTNDFDKSTVPDYPNQLDAVENSLTGGSPSADSVAIDQAGATMTEEKNTAEGKATDETP